MAQAFDIHKAVGEVPRRLCYYNAGFWRDARLRRILQLAGHDLQAGRADAAAGVVVWGRSPYAHRGEAVAAKRGLPLVRVEDAFLRSIKTGRSGEPTIGLLIDPMGVHFDASQPSLIETLLARHPLDDSTLLTRARDGIARLQALDISKYNTHDTAAALPAAGYVLVIDQTRGDASIRHSGASETRFAEMLTAAKLDHPRARIVIKTHPETVQGHRKGHFSAADCDDRTTLLASPVSPWRLLEGAIAVYAVSSQMGFEAILAGHRPHLFGNPFYAGWGLSTDDIGVPRRQRALTKTQVFAAAMILAPRWYDPVRDALCQFEDAVDDLEARTRALRQDRMGYVAGGMRSWKRARLQQVFGQSRALGFCDPPEKALALAQKTGRAALIWAGKLPDPLPEPLPAPLYRVEDGFLRSRGLGANLVPPLSLVTDDLGIYYDATQESRLERHILAPLPAGARDRAEKLRKSLIGARLSKYNLGVDKPAIDLGVLGPGRRILVPGQVEDDASLRFGAGEVCTNMGLIAAAVAANPSARILYKPHPDVEAGLRPGAIAPADLVGLADYVATDADPIALIEACDEVWTMTSLLGFEALLRGKPVTCLGAPFYAGWGLTKDLGPVPKRRKYALDGHPLPRPDLAQVVHATLIAYPRYFDPVTRQACSPEAAVFRLAQGLLPAPSLRLRLLAKLQGRFATYAHLWRR